MVIDILSAFPSIVSESLQFSIVKRAISKGAVDIRIHNLRNWAKDRHKTIDDTPYGGGAGMIYMVEPLYDALQDIIANQTSEKRNIVLTSPRGNLFVQETAVKFSLVDHLVIICGHYKGVDERIKEFFPIKEVSIGDYVLSGGEYPALVIVDAVVRLLPGVISDIDSAWSDSFNDNLLDCDYYTRPEVFKDKGVPEVLKSGDHKKIENWKNEKREKITRERRPDLYEKYINEIKNK
jgi:tRNA (guanine37-N1)-methyltransferase